jgi:hypothetical protein
MDYTEPSGHNFFALKKNLTSWSAAKEWSDVVKEWELFDAYFYRCEGDAPSYGLGQCLCNHAPIIEHAILRNRITNKLAIVGNVCVRRFLNKDSTKFFDCVKRIRADIFAAPNGAVIELAKKRGLFTYGDQEFFQKTKRVRKPNEYQRQRRKRFNERLLAHMERCAGIVQEKAAAARPEAA